MLRPHLTAMRVILEGAKKTDYWGRVKLKSVGDVASKPASELKAGDVIQYDHGWTFTVAKVRATAKGVTVDRINNSTGDLDTKSFKADVPVAVPTRANEMGQEVQLRRALAFRELAQSVPGVFSGAHTLPAWEGPYGEAAHAELLDDALVNALRTRPNYKPPPEILAKFKGKLVDTEKYLATYGAAQ
jgi:hypothetical protein